MRPSACEGPSHLLWDCFEETIVPAMSAIVRRQAAMDIGGFREEIRTSPDFEFWLRLSAKHPFVWTREVTANYRRHPHQISATPGAQRLSTHYSRALTTRVMFETGELELSQRMRQRTAELLDDDLGNSWWSADMPRVRELLALARSLGIDTEYSRQLQRLSWMPAPGVRALRTLRTFIGRP
jgi:hypothetical protein